MKLKSLLDNCSGRVQSTYGANFLYFLCFHQRSELILGYALYQSPHNVLNLFFGVTNGCVTGFPDTRVRINVNTLIREKNGLKAIKSPLQAENLLMQQSRETLNSLNIKH